MNPEISKLMKEMRDKAAEQTARAAKAEASLAEARVELQTVQVLLVSARQEVAMLKAAEAELQSLRERLEKAIAILQGTVSRHEIQQAIALLTQPEHPTDEGKEPK